MEITLSAYEHFVISVWISTLRDEFSYYTPAPVSDLPVSVQNPAIDGHSVRLSTELSDSEAHVADYDTITKFQNLGFDTIMSIRLKISDIEEKHNLSTLI